MRIFVTGGTGFLGSHFLNLALRAGHAVVAPRRPGSQPRIPLSGSPEWLEGELVDDHRAKLGGCGALVHFASRGVSPQITTWGEAFETNVSASLALCEQAVEAGVPHLVTCGSCVEYGRSSDRYDFVPADAPLEPVGAYAASKASFFVGVLGLARTTGVALTHLRPFNLYGEGQFAGNFWPSLRAAALAGKDFSMSAGEQVRDFQPVEDAATAFLKAVEGPVPTSPVVANLGTGCPTTLKAFAESWWNTWNATGRLRLGDVAYRAGESMRFVPAL